MVFATSGTNFTNVVGFIWSNGYFLNTSILASVTTLTAFSLDFPLDCTLHFFEINLYLCEFISSTRMWIWLGGDIIWSPVLGAKVLKDLGEPSAGYSYPLFQA